MGFEIPYRALLSLEPVTFNSPDGILVQEPGYGRERVLLSIPLMGFRDPGDVPEALWGSFNSPDGILLGLDKLIAHGYGAFNSPDGIPEAQPELEASYEIANFQFP